MAFEITGAVVVESALEAGVADAFLAEAMPLAFDAVASTAGESILGAGASSLAGTLGAETVPAAITASVTPAAESAVVGGAGAGEGITAATPGALQTGAAEAPSAFAETAPQGINQVASSNVSGAMSDVGVNPDYTAWKNAIDTNQFVPNQELSPDVLKATGNMPVNAAPPVSAPPSAPMTSPEMAPVNTPMEGVQPTAPTAPNPAVAPKPTDTGFMQGFNQFVDNHPFLTGAGIYGVASATGMLNQPQTTFGQQPTSTYNSPYHFDAKNFKASHPDPNVYKPSYAGYAKSNYASGGITQAAPTPGLMDGGQTAQVDFMGKDMYPMSQQDNSHYATPSQMPTSAQQTMASYEPNTNPLTGEMTSTNMAAGGQVPGYAGGGSLLQQLIDSFNQSGQMPTQDQYLAAQGLHSSFNPDYAFDKSNGKFVPMSSITPMEQQPGLAPAPSTTSSSDSGGGGAYAGGSMPNELNYASGGIAGYYRGGDLATSNGRDAYASSQKFLEMYDPSSRYTAPADASHPDVGIFNDSSPTTRYQDAVTAAATRQNALNKKANIRPGTNYAKPTVSMGQINVGVPSKDTQGADNSEQILAASGGIMGANLGGYAAGGNPRLLRGPGDGMSDDIPATIGGRQPARLADGEFVVPADVVSGLGNGSTDAGAKLLHQMMDKVRVDRTGKKKQAPAIKSGKYIPK